MKAAIKEIANSASAPNFVAFYFAFILSLFYTILLVGDSLAPM